MLEQLVVIKIAEVALWELLSHIEQSAACKRLSGIKVDVLSEVVLLLLSTPLVRILHDGWVIYLSEVALILSSLRRLFSLILVLELWRALSRKISQESVVHTLHVIGLVEV